MEYGILGIVLFLVYKLMNKTTYNDKIYDSAFSLIGETEIVGAVNNPKIVEMANIYGYSDDDVAWCSSFVAYCVNESGLSVVGTTAAARSWLHWGLPTTTPKKGDICVMWRESPSSVYGHVGIVDSVGTGYVTLISGNDNNAVRLRSFDSSKVLGYRTPDVLNATL